jgi:iron complex transport system substrate-binding protein
LTAVAAALLGALLAASAAVAGPSVKDDAGNTVSLAQPAQRIISLAPHTTELLFAVGAGAHLLAVSEYSDYPEQAKTIPSIGNVFSPDLERILALRPDLVVIWGTGNASAVAAKLRELHLNVYESEPHDYEGIASSLERLGALTGNEANGRNAATSFRQRLQALRNRYQQTAGQPVSVFYQIWRSPLMTLNDSHFASAAIRLCGGENIFGKLREISPTVNLEAVLQNNPEVILAADGEKQDVLADWQRFPKLLAVQRGNLATLKGDLINRAGPRILDGTQAICTILDEARKKRR